MHTVAEVECTVQGMVSTILGRTQLSGPCIPSKYATNSELLTSLNDPSPDHVSFIVPTFVIAYTIVAPNKFFSSYNL